MKNIFVFTLVSLLLILVAACSQTSNDAPALDDTIIEQPIFDEQPPTVSNTDDAVASADDDFGVGGWADGNVFEYSFLINMDDLALICEIVDYYEVEKFANELNGQLKKRCLPYVYSAIQYFDIPEETFREYNSRKIEQNNQYKTEGVTYTDSEVAALYCGDEAEMLERLKSPYAFFDGQEVFIVYEILEMDAGELIQANFALDDLSEYCDWVQGEIEMHHIDGFVDVQWFEEAFDEFRQELAAAQQMLIEMGTVQQELLEEELELELEE
ncbi:MAG: hypothetical protein FWG43_02590 [Clostridiales bacterium]|nr:hypothetical protein [Clostridiales bacterium]